MVTGVRLPRAPDFPNHNDLMGFGRPGGAPGGLPQTATFPSEGLAMGCAYYYNAGCIFLKSALSKCKWMDV